MSEQMKDKFKEWYFYPETCLVIRTKLDGIILS